MPTVNDTRASLSPCIDRPMGKLFFPVMIKPCELLPTAVPKRWEVMNRNVSNAATRIGSFIPVKSFLPSMFFKQTQACWGSTRAFAPGALFSSGFHASLRIAPLVSRHQKALYPVLFRAARSPCKALAADSRYVEEPWESPRAHTWSGAMIYHPISTAWFRGGLTSRDKESYLARASWCRLSPFRQVSGTISELGPQSPSPRGFFGGGAVKNGLFSPNRFPPHNAQTVLNYLGRYLTASLFPTPPCWNSRDSDYLPL